MVVTHEMYYVFNGFLGPSMLKRANVTKVTYIAWEEQIKVLSNTWWMLGGLIKWTKMDKMRMKNSNFDSQSSPTGPCKLDTSN